MVDRTEISTGSEGGREDAGGAGQKVKESARHAQEKTSEVAAKAKQKGEHLMDEGREKVQELAHQAGDKARSRAEEEKGRVAAGVRTMADALRRGSQDLPEDRRAYGRFVEAAADRVEGLSRYLEDRDVGEMAGEARQFARDHTGVVLSGAFALGLLGARFLKSSADDGPSERWTSPGYGGERTYEAGYRTSGGYPEPAGDRPGGYSRGEVRREGMMEPGRSADEREELDRLGGPNA